MKSLTDGIIASYPFVESAKVPDKESLCGWESLWLARVNSRDSLVVPLFAGDIWLPHSLGFMREYFHQASSLQLLLMGRPVVQGRPLAAVGRVPVFRRLALEEAVHHDCQLDGLSVEELPFQLVYRMDISGNGNNFMEESPVRTSSTEHPGSQQSPQLKSPKLSVIIPYYNNHQFFPEALACLEAQSFHDFEVLIVDDGSDSSSFEQMHSLVLQSTRNIRIHRQSNHGLSYTRNMGVLQSRGEFSVFFDPDDLIDPLCLEKLVWKLDQRPDLDFCFPGTVHFGVHQFINMQPFDPQRF